ncbi:MAG: hypothetical protein MR357_00495 [Anaeroplasma sp.]|nr:hypothetical protein [Anaeroplasma sp.]
MSNLFSFFKDNFKIIIGSILIYQIFLTIFFFSTENIVILACIIIIFAGYALISTYNDDITGFFKK